jgi:hypothetical protein
LLEIKSKQNIMRYVFTTLLLVAFVFLAKAQTTINVSNPSGYILNETVEPIEFNGNTFYSYRSTTTYKNEMVKYNGSTFSFIPKPDAGYGYLGSPVVYNNNLYIRYSNASGKNLLAKYNGTSIDTIPNPDAGGQYSGSPIVFNGNMYAFYYNALGKSVLAKYDGTNLTIVTTNPDSGFGCYGFPIVYNGNLYVRYLNASNKNVLAKYDGTNLTIIPNPDAGNGYNGSPIIYNGNLYILYINASNSYLLAKCDGTNLTTIPNPNGGLGYVGFPIVYNGNLYIRYSNATYKYLLAKYDGTNITTISNPDAGNGYFGDPVIYNGNLYIYYNDASGKNVLAKYDGTNLTATIPNPDAGIGLDGSLLVYNGNIYFKYRNASYKNAIAKYNDTIISLFNNAVSTDEGVDGRFHGALNRLLFYNVISSAGPTLTENLAYVDATPSNAALPVTLLSFTATKQHTADLITWKTSNEINNDYFVVEHSTNAKTFTSVGQVKANAINGNGSYNLLNERPANGHNYYRLAQVDIDGKTTYSNVIDVVRYENTNVSIYPNPATNSVTVSMSNIEKGTITIKLQDITGKTIKEIEMVSTQNNLNVVLDLNTVSIGTYFIEVKNNNTSIQTTKIFRN